ncbi:DegT/DnrJ/EryC1/StrS family aminotransferase [Vibrio paucivorans]|uniref:DegT/DnrJ/EryC1/StrS family aminotransferase n=1 Tax=Vibrio paucivorans TaxID=2829489 RepID=A0A9X3CBT0_9VIBR|nr:DegT/DnrJ/EryC1/StrS family aminotransferase [Vibrio paucivorans]MCW8332812.1 DegT/DnrJ/EryC1/StrS family aminotransferase [Vibrio paucivorans]
MTPVTKPYLPNKEKYKNYIDRIYESGHLTNNGPLLKELEQRLADYLGVKHVICVANGSLALQIAYKALNITGEVITTPFTFAATSSTLLWEGLKPVYCDISSNSWNIDSTAIEKLITKDTSAIVPVHVFGNPCEVEKIQEIANKYSLKVIYDAAHAFGVKYKGGSVLKYGDISTLSFHATKLFHTIEGGAVITESDEVAERIRKLINFGVTGPETIEGLGTNAKMNEFEAAMGLCVLDDMEGIIDSRTKSICEYKRNLGDEVSFQRVHESANDLVAYFPILMESESAVHSVIKALQNQEIYPRRYFYPSLDGVYGSNNLCKNSNEISKSILCLPLFHTMDKGLINNICRIIKEGL